MNHLNHPGEYNRMMETARKRASELRRDAVVEFWDDAASWAGRLARAATRLGHRVVRHSRSRQQLEG